MSRNTAGSHGGRLEQAMSSSSSRNRRRWSASASSASAPLSARSWTCAAAGRSAPMNSRTLSSACSSAASLTTAILRSLVASCDTQCGTELEAFRPASRAGPVDHTDVCARGCALHRHWACRRHRARVSLTRGSAPKRCSRDVLSAVRKLLGVGFSPRRHRHRRQLETSTLR